VVFQAYFARILLLWFWLLDVMQLRLPISQGWSWILMLSSTNGFIRGWSRNKKMRCDLPWSSSSKFASHEWTDCPVYVKITTSSCWNPTPRLTSPWHSAPDLGRQQLPSVDQGVCRCHQNAKSRSEIECGRFAGVGLPRCRKLLGYER